MTCSQVYCVLVVVAAGTPAAVIVLVCRRALTEWFLLACRTEGNLIATERETFELTAAHTSHGTPQGTRRAHALVIHVLHLRLRAVELSMQEAWPVF